MEVKKQVFISEIREINEKDQTITALVSTKAVDRMGDIIEPKGVDMKSYRKNPIVLWAHDYKSPPIAKAQWIKTTDGGILSKMKFATTEFAKEIFNLYKEGFLRAFSVGFVPKEMEDITDKDGKWQGYKFIKSELLEYSAVPVPANPEALALAIQKGILTDDKLIKALEVGPDEEEEPEEEKPEEKPEKKPEEEIEEDPAEESNKGLAELWADYEELKEMIESLKQENADLRKQLFVVLQNANKGMLSEITDDAIVQKVNDIVVGVVRQAQGKV